MSRFQWLAAAAAVLIASPALAQTAPDRSNDKAEEVSPSIAPATTMRVEDLEETVLPPDMEAYTPPPHSWEPASASRLQRGRDLGASSGRVIRACEINLALGDEDCAAP